MTGYADRHRQITDRQAYTASLETQLQRATHALTAAQAFSEKVDVLQTQLNSVEDKVINITRLAKLQQTCSEGQEQELQRLGAEVTALMSAKSAHDSGLLSRKLENVELRLRNLEERGTDHGGTAINARVVSEIDHSLRETENRIATVLERTNLDIEHKQQLLQEQLTRAMEQCFQDCRALDRRLSETEQFSSFGHQRSSLESLKLPRSGAPDSSFLLELREVKESAWNSELTCNRLAEDSLNRIAACERLLRDLELTVRDTLKIRDAHVAKEDLSALDRKLSEKLNEACDRLGDVVRTSARSLSSEVEGLARRTKSLERSVELRQASPTERQTLSFTSSPPHFEAAHFGNSDGLLEAKSSGPRAKSAPRAKTPPKKRELLAKDLEPAKTTTPKKASKTESLHKGAVTPPKKAVTPPKKVPKRSPTPPKRTSADGTSKAVSPHQKEARRSQTSRSPQLTSKENIRDSNTKAVSPRLTKDSSREPKSKRSLTPKKTRTPRMKKQKKSPSPTYQTHSPTTLKSKARDDAIKDKFKTTEKRPGQSDRRSRLEQLYQKLSAKSD